MITKHTRALLTAVTLASSTLVACAGDDATSQGQEQDLTMAGDDGVPMEEGGEFELFFVAESDVIFKYAWRLEAANGEEILAGQTIASKNDALDAIRYAAHAGQVDEAFRFSPAPSNPDGLAGGEWFFELVGFDQQVLGTSEVYASKSNAERGMKAVMSTIGLATTDDWTDLCGHVLQRYETGVYVPSLAAHDGASLLIASVDTAEPDVKDRIRRALVAGVHRESFVVRELDNGEAYVDLVAADGEVVLTTYYNYVSSDDATLAADNLAQRYQELAGCELPSGS